jgi:hypothetical protein
MRYSLILLPFLASSALAQDDVWKTLNKGDRIQVTFRSGNMILGNLDHKPGDPRLAPTTIDYSAASEITIDLSLEYPGLNGTMTIPKKEIKEIRKLQNLDPATMKRIQEEMRRIQALAAADEAGRKTAEAERDKLKEKERKKKDEEDKDKDKDKEDGVKALKDLEDLQKGKELLKRVPPDKWGPQTASAVAEKSLRKQPVTAEEREFLQEDNQKLWNLALRNQQEKEAKSKEKTEEKKQ